MTITDNRIDTDINWSTRSPLLELTPDQMPLLIFSIIFGSVIIIHSCYLNGSRYNEIRIITDIASISMIGSATCFLSCINSNCSLFTETITNNILANSFFGLICQSCDNYITFERYNKIVGKTSTTHKIITFIYWIVFLCLTWLPMFTVFPIWFDQNAEIWVFVDSIVLNYINFTAYILYNTFYITLTFLEITKLKKSSLSINNIYLIEIAIRSICHTTFSTIGIILYVFHLPSGSIEQTICVAGSIHVFINWKFKMKNIVKIVNGGNYRSVYITQTSIFNDESKANSITVNFTQPVVVNNLESSPIEILN